MNEKYVINKLKDIYMELSEKHEFYLNCSLQIVLSNRLRSSNGNCYIRFGDWTKKEVVKAKITMSKALLTEIGWEEFEKTFRHEVAHLANAVLYGKSGHDFGFKVLCRDFGGTMNRKMAGYQFSDCASDPENYVKTIKKWEYTCPCGKKKLMAKRMSRKKRGNRGYRCGKCRKYTFDTWTEKQLV